MILVDTNLFVAFVNKNDKYHGRSVELMKKLITGEYGRRITIDYVLDEVITTTWIRTKKIESVKKVYELINGESSNFDVHMQGSALIDNAWKVYNKYFSPKKPLSFTDCVIIAYCQQNNIKLIVSFDDEFDGILQRIS